MVVDPNGFVSFLSWLPGGLLAWVLIVAIVVGIATAVAWLVAAIRHGPVAAFGQTVRLLREAIIDLVGISPRRVAALAWLSIKESIRRRVVVVFAIFILVLSFAGWFLDPSSVNPGRLYLSFVLTATSYLILLLALFLSSLSLPAEFKSRTLYTIVTKPVRASEIVLGRILGFAAVGTCLLAVMGVSCYVFVEKGLWHTHKITAKDLQPVDASQGQAAGLRGKTSRVNGHRHVITTNATGTEGRVEMEQGHWHELTAAKEGDAISYQLGSPQGQLVARVPLYGKLTFRDRDGAEGKDKGANVGDEWDYRSFVEGGTLAAAVWEFDGITEEAFPNGGLPAELTIRIFRTNKGNIERGILGSLAVRNPKTGEKVDVKIFESKEDLVDEQFIPRELQTAEGEKRDLFRDMVDNGKLEIWLKCVEPQQYLGAARADLYLRAGDASFAMNFAKGYFGIWLQMMLVIGLGVFFSTFLSGPVAMISTLGALVGGFYSEFMYKMATGNTYGGGPAESVIRILTQVNVTIDLEPGLRTTAAVTADRVMGVWLQLMANILPDFGKFSFADYVAYGFNISGDTILTFTCRALGFLVPVFVAAYLCLKTREVAK
jgi:hypothetical protein